MCLLHARRRVGGGLIGGRGADCGELRAGRARRAVGRPRKRRRGAARRHHELLDRPDGAVGRLRAVHRRRVLHGQRPQEERPRHHGDERDRHRADGRAHDRGGRLRRAGVGLGECVAHFGEPDGDVPQQWGRRTSRMFLRLPEVWLADDPEACAGNADRYVQFSHGRVQLLPERREAGREQENKLLGQAEEFVCDAYRRAQRLQHRRRLDDDRLHDPRDSSVQPRAHAGRNQAARDDRPDPVLRRAGRTHAVRQQMRADRHGGNGRHGGSRRRQCVAGRDGEDGVHVLA